MLKIISFKPPAAAGLVFDLPALAFRVAGIHPEEFGSEQSRFFAAGAGPYLHDGVRLVIRVLGKQKDHHGLLELLRFGRHFRKLAFGQFDQLVILVVRDDLFAVLDGRLGVLEGAPGLHHVLQVFVAAGQFAQTLGVGGGLGQPELFFDLSYLSFLGSYVEYFHALRQEQKKRSPQPVKIKRAS